LYLYLWARWRNKENVTERNAWWLNLKLLPHNSYGYARVLNSQTKINRKRKKRKKIREKCIV